jgi:hypothetical protein
MANYPEAFHHMLAAWNEHDLSLLRGHLERALAPDVLFIDSSIVTRGIEEFEANMREFRGRLPDFDVVQADENGRVLRVEGFFGPLPHY